VKQIACAQRANISCSTARSSFWRNVRHAQAVSPSRSMRPLSQERVHVVYPRSFLLSLPLFSLSSRYDKRYARTGTQHRKPVLLSNFPRNCQFSRDVAVSASYSNLKTSTPVILRLGARHSTSVPRS